MPSATPNTATWSHSRPFTRWIVDSVTPSGRPPAGTRRAATARTRSSSGCRSATPSSPSRSSRWLEPWPPPVRSSRLIADAEPDVVADRLQDVADRADRPASATSSRSSARRSDLGGVLVRHLVGDAARPAPGLQRARRSSRSGNHWRQARGRPAEDLDDVAGRHRRRRRRRCAGRRARPACRCARARPGAAPTTPGRRPRAARRAAPAAAS